MFKISSFEQELMEGMSQKLIQNESEDSYSYNKIAKVADYLNAAAELLDDTGMYKEAEAVTRLLESFASKGKKKL
jgi:hypothetical protein